MSSDGPLSSHETELAERCCRAEVQQMHHKYMYQKGRNTDKYNIHQYSTNSTVAICIAMHQMQINFICFITALLNSQNSQILDCQNSGLSVTGKITLMLAIIQMTRLY